MGSGWEPLGFVLGLSARYRWTVAFPSSRSVLYFEQTNNTEGGAQIAEITDPHDTFFKALFSRAEVAEEFLLRFLPPDVSGLLAPKTFRLQKDSFVDTNLQAYFSDLLYRVGLKAGEQGWVYILFEHKSQPRQDIAFQLLRYMMRIWERTRTEGMGWPAPIIPVVLYHGRTEWRIPLDFGSMYAVPESLKRRLLDFTYCLCDLSQYTDEEIKLGAIGTVGVRLLKHIHSEDLADRLAELLGLLRTMHEETALEFLETVLRYLGSAAQAVTVDDCRKALGAAFPETGETYMTGWIDQIVEERRHDWFEEGVKEGVKEGIRKGAASLAVRMLVRKFGSLDADLEKRVRQLSPEQLERLGEDLFDLSDQTALADWLDRVEKPGWTA
ncbi:MAG: Rpn family recombination-promoting nuclease/putative transposase [Thermodesulfobacteriota bacterium]